MRQASEIRFKYDGREYEWVEFSSRFAPQATLRSYERGVTVGDVRSIGGRLFTAFAARKRVGCFFSRTQVSWEPAGEITSDDIHQIKCGIFGWWPAEILVRVAEPPKNPNAKKTK